MKKLLAMLLIALLAVAPALAEEDALAKAAVPEGEAVGLDLDGDGAEETLSWDMEPLDEYDEHLVLTLASGGTTARYETEYIYGGAVYAADLDGDGATELLLSGDVASDDYFTTCLRWADGELVRVPFADGNRGENGDEDVEEGYGKPVALSGDTITLSGSQDVLGTWFATRDYALRGGRLGFADDGEWARDLADIDLADETFWAEAYAVLTTKVPLACAAADGSPAELPAGTKLLVMGSDKASYARFVTSEGVKGTLAIAPDTQRGWGMTVNGRSEDECFEFVPYAD